MNKLFEHVENNAFKLKEMKKGSQDFGRLGVSTKGEYSLDPEELAAIVNMSTKERDKFLKRKKYESRIKRGMCVDCATELSGITTHTAPGKISGSPRLAVRCPKCLEKMKNIINKIKIDRKRNHQPITDYQIE